MRFPPDSLLKIALVNFGGIGDEILFSPVMAEVRAHLPQAHLTLFLEDRSAAVKDLLPQVDTLVEMTVQGRPRLATFFQLVSLLRRKHFDAVISSGSSPYIPLALWLSGIPLRVGFQTGKSSRRFLTAEAPLDRQAYAADMYFTLATTFLATVFGSAYTPPERALPCLAPPPETDRAWARDLLAGTADGDTRAKVLLHPGVSRVSVAKGILKTWPIGRWAELAQALSADHRVFLVGGPDDGPTVEAIAKALPEGTATSLYGQTRSLRQLAALMSEADLLVSVDSAPMHLAVGLGCPVLALFGPTDPKKLLPDTPKSRAVYRADLACRPCLWDVHQTNCATSDCLRIPVEAVVAEARTLLAR